MENLNTTSIAEELVGSVGKTVETSQQEQQNIAQEDPTARSLPSNEPNPSTRREFAKECIALVFGAATISTGIDSLKKPQTSHKKRKTSRVTMQGKNDHIIQKDIAFSKNGVRCEGAITGRYKDNQCTNLTSPCISLVLSGGKRNKKISLAQDTNVNRLILDGAESSSRWTEEKRSLLVEALGPLVSTTEAEKDPPPNIWNSNIHGRTHPEILAWFQNHPQEGAEEFLWLCLKVANYHLGEKNTTDIPAVDQ